MLNISAPAVIPLLYLVITPVGVIFPIPLVPLGVTSVNHTLPSGPAVMPAVCAPAPVRPVSYSVATPVVVIFPIRPPHSVHHRLPSSQAVLVQSSQVMSA